MKYKIRFTRNTTPKEADGDGYKAGDEVEVDERSMSRWLRRKAAEKVESDQAKRGPGRPKQNQQNKEQ